MLLITWCAWLEEERKSRVVLGVGGGVAPGKEFKDPSLCGLSADRGCGIGYEEYQPEGHEVLSSKRGALHISFQGSSLRGSELQP